MGELAPYLLTGSSAILLLLGLLHLLYTFHGPKLLPRDAELQERMSSVSPILTRETTMWKAWVGFNASHSFGAILFGLVYGYLALLHPAFLFDSAFLLVVGLVLLGGHTFLGVRYWFSVPYAAFCWHSLCMCLRSSWQHDSTINEDNQKPCPGRRLWQTFVPVRI
jgi:hypothetical protein